MNVWTVTVEVGARLAHDGELWTVVAMEAGCVVLAGPRGARKRVVTATLLADATTRVLGRARSFLHRWAQSSMT